MNLKVTNYETKVQFFIRSEKELEKFFDSLDVEEPFVAEIKSAEFKLLAGLSKKICSIQFTRNDDKPPYLMALTKSRVVRGEFNFMCGGTPTPIEGKFCLPIDQAKEIIRFFAETGKPLEKCNWEEI